MVRSTFMLWILAVIVLLLGAIVFFGDDREFSDTFMTYCQEYSETDIDNIAQITNWFPGSEAECVKALECLDNQMSVSEKEYENTFANMIGEFSDPMAYLVAQCVDKRAWIVFVAQRPYLRD
jgi:hypothetical protein